MTYVEGFLIPCPTANKAAYLAHAEQMAAVFSDCGATRMVQAWGDDVPDGNLDVGGIELHRSDRHRVLLRYAGLRAAAEHRECEHHDEREPHQCA